MLPKAACKSHVNSLEAILSTATEGFIIIFLSLFDGDVVELNMKYHFISICRRQNMGLYSYFK